MARTYYDWLEISENASPEVIRGSFKFLVQKWHPDKHRDDPELARLLLREINKAYEELSNPERRAAYDLWLLQQREQHQGFDRRRRSQAGRTERARKRKQSGKRRDGHWIDTWV